MFARLKEQRSYLVRGLFLLWRCCRVIGGMACEIEVSISKCRQATRNGSGRSFRESLTPDVPAVNWVDSSSVFDIDKSESCVKRRVEGGEDGRKENGLATLMYPVPSRGGRESRLPCVVRECG